MQVDLESRAEELVRALDASVVPWLERCVADEVRRHGSEPTAELLGEARRAAEAAHDELMPQVASLLQQDIDEQATTPLALVRRCVLPVTDVLRRAGVPEADRDEFRRRHFPEDLYDLAPAGFAELTPDERRLPDVALAWGAAKAYEHKRRHG